jgi:hypothetical protein
VGLSFITNEKWRNWEEKQHKLFDEKLNRLKEDLLTELKSTHNSTIPHTEVSIYLKMKKGNKFFDLIDDFFSIVTESRICC